MQRKRTAPITAAVSALVAGLFALPSAAHADGGATLYVNHASAVCSDSGPGTQAAPFCTIAKAAGLVDPGDTVVITGGAYNENVTLTRSGTSVSPITFTGPGVINALLNNVTLSGTGVHDLVFSQLTFSNTGATTGVVLSDSSHLAFTRTTVANATGGVSGLVLNNITDSTFSRVTVATDGHTAIAVDAASARLSFDHVTVTAVAPKISEPGITIAGSTISVTRSVAQLFGGNLIEVEPSASHVTLARDRLTSSMLSAIDVIGGSDVAIANNYAYSNCGDSITVEAPATNVSIENNIANHSGTGPVGCIIAPGRVEIAVHGAATGSTTVDYNNVQNTAGPGLYSWDETTSIASVAAFRTISSQGGHDQVGTTAAADITDSANSDAPGFLMTDNSDRTLEDDPQTPNTGVGTIAYADRGANERMLAPLVSLHLTPTVTAGALTVAADVSIATPGGMPITKILYNWGDNTTTTQTATTATHTYDASAPPPMISVFASDSNNVAGSASRAAYTTFIPLSQSLARDVTIAPGGVTTVAAAGFESFLPGQSQAIALNLYVADPAASGALTAYDHSASRPVTSSLRFGAHQTRSSLVTVPLTSTSVDVYNSSSEAVTVSASAEGWWENRFPGMSYKSVTPQAVFNGDVNAGEVASLTLTNTNMVPVVQITTSQAIASGALELTDTGADPTIYGVRVAVQAGATQSYLAIAPWTMDVHNTTTGRVHVTITLVGWYAYPQSATKGTYQNTSGPVSALTAGSTKPVTAHLSVPAGAKYAYVRLGISAAATGTATVSVAGTTLTYSANQPVDETIIVPVTPTPLRTGIVYQANLTIKPSTAAIVTLQVTGYQIDR